MAQPHLALSLSLEEVSGHELGDPPSACLSRGHPGLSLSNSGLPPKNKHPQYLCHNRSVVEGQLG